LYWWLRCAAPGEPDLKRLIPGALGLVILEVVVGLLSWLLPERIPQDWVGYSSERTIGTLGFAHVYSLTLVFFSLLLFQAAMNRKSGVARWGLLLGAGLGACGVFLSFSRGAWLGGLVAGVGLLVLYPKPVLSLTVIMLSVMLLLGGTVLSAQITFANERLNSGTTALERLSIWDAGLHMAELKPFWGWGYGDYALYSTQFQQRIANVETTSKASHNTFISLAAELGVPGLILYLLPAMGCLGLTLKRWPYLPQTGFWSRKLLIIFWLMILAYSTTSFFSDIRTSPYGMSLWWVTLGWIGILVDPYRARS
jgi:O-antigen ligase